MNNSDTEHYILSPWAQKKRLTHCFIYRGHSMIPTFKKGDFLYLRSPKKKLMPGDVIVFTVPHMADCVVHRIVSCSNIGFITRGDHNRLPDTSPVTLEQIVGTVDFVGTRNGIRRVLHGFWGTRVAGILQVMLGVDHLIRRMFWIPYKFFREKQLAAIFWRPKIFKIQVQSENGKLIKYLYKNRAVAVWNLTHQRFNCRKPFDLIIPSPLKIKKPSS